MKKTLISIAIWFGSGIASIILMNLITDVHGIIPLFVYFLLPNVVILAPDGLNEGVGFIYSIFSLFKKQQKTNEELEAVHKRSLGRLAIPVSVFLYGFAGFILAYFYSDQFKASLITFLIVGLVWGIIVRYLLRNEFFDMRDNY